jgi:hypothetical protein
MTPSRAGPRPRVLLKCVKDLNAAAKERWADPTTSAKLRAALGDPAIRSKLGEAGRARWADPAAREE